MQDAAQNTCILDHLSRKAIKEQTNIQYHTCFPCTKICRNNLVEIILRHFKAYLQELKIRVRNVQNFLRYLFASLSIL